ncbi:hypothetical protein [Pedobacter cryoconitis]|nr:hypothetical protein [Pedobacter cryoconitis]
MFSKLAVSSIRKADFTSIG